MLNRFAATLGLSLACSACATLGNGSHLGTSDGFITAGTRLADEGEGFVRARPGETTAYGTSALVGMLQRAAAQVSATFPGPPLRIGDLSYPQGGAHPRHHSHRSGRDVDIIFYATDVWGGRVPGSGFIAYDHHGVGVSPETGDIRLFDQARNWAFVRALITDEEAELQWIFVSFGVKRQLLEYAARIESDPKVLFRAAWLLQQPSSGAPHDDHFHVRIRCSATEAQTGIAPCVERGPEWIWWSDNKPTAVFAASDEELTTWLFQE